MDEEEEDGMDDNFFPGSNEDHALNSGEVSDSGEDEVREAGEDEEDRGAGEISRKLYWIQLKLAKARVTVHAQN